MTHLINRNNYILHLMTSLIAQFNDENVILLISPFFNIVILANSSLLLLFLVDENVIK